MAFNVAKDLRNELENHSSVKSTYVNAQGGVYVEVTGPKALAPAITIGHDYGWTPNGIVDEGFTAFRLRPRGETQTDV